MFNKPAQVLTEDEILNIKQEFANLFQYVPNIKHKGKRLVFYSNGIKLVLYCGLMKNGRRELEILSFSLPKQMRNKGLGRKFMSRILNKCLKTEEFQTIRLIPLNKKARNFWEKVGFERSNMLFLYFNNKRTFSS